MNPIRKESHRVKHIARQYLQEHGKKRDKENYQNPSLGSVVRCIKLMLMLANHEEIIETY